MCVFVMEVGQILHHNLTITRFARFDTKALAAKSDDSDSCLFLEVYNVYHYMVYSGGHNPTVRLIFLRFLKYNLQVVVAMSTASMEEANQYLLLDGS